MKKFFALFVVVAMFLTAVAMAQEPVPPTGQPPVMETDTSPKLRHGCEQLFTQKQFKRYSRKVFRRKVIKRKAKRHMRSMIYCQHSDKAERKMRKRYAVEVRARKYRIAVAQLTPHGPCFGGMWAVPCSIIDCESDGEWYIWNKDGSGAAGPYQLLGWGAPMPSSPTSNANFPKWMKLVHHRIAARLAADGLANHWSQCM